MTEINNEPKHGHGARLEFHLSNKAAAALFALMAAFGGVGGIFYSQLSLLDCSSCQKYAYQCETRNHRWEEWYTAHGASAITALGQVQRLGALDSLPKYYAGAK